VDHEATGPRTLRLKTGTRISGTSLTWNGLRAASRNGAVLDLWHDICARRRETGFGGHPPISSWPGQSIADVQAIGEDRNRQLSAHRDGPASPDRRRSSEQKHVVPNIATQRLTKLRESNTATNYSASTVQLTRAPLRSTEAQGADFGFKPASSVHVGSRVREEYS